MIKNKSSPTLSPSSCQPKYLLPDLRLVTGEQGRVYGSGMINNEMTMTPAAPGNFNGVMPEFGRWRDVERLFGIKRGTLYNLMAEGKVKSVFLRHKGNVHGCRLIHLASVSEYLNSLMSQQQSQ